MDDCQLARKSFKIILLDLNSFAVSDGEQDNNSADNDKPPIVYII